MCRVRLRDRIPIIELCRRLGIEEVVVVMRRGRLRWFGHVERKSASNWASACRSMATEGEEFKRRGQKSGIECVKSNMKMSGLKVEWAQDREIWGSLLSGKRRTRASMETQTLKR